MKNLTTKKQNRQYYDNSKNYQFISTLGEKFKKVTKDTKIFEIEKQQLSISEVLKNINKDKLEKKVSKFKKEYEDNSLALSIDSEYCEYDELLLLLIDYNELVEKYVQTKKIDMRLLKHIKSKYSESVKELVNTIKAKYRFFIDTNTQEYFEYNLLIPMIITKIEDLSFTEQMCEEINKKYLTVFKKRINYIFQTETVHTSETSYYYGTEKIENYISDLKIENTTEEEIKKAAYVLKGSGFYDIEKVSDELSNSLNIEVLKLEVTNFVIGKLKEFKTKIIEGTDIKLRPLNSKFEIAVLKGAIEKTTKINTYNIEKYITQMCKFYKDQQINKKALLQMNDMLFSLVKEYKIKPTVGLKNRYILSIKTGSYELVGTPFYEFLNKTECNVIFTKDEKMEVKNFYLAVNLKYKNKTDDLRKMFQTLSYENSTIDSKTKMFVKEKLKNRLIESFTESYQKKYLSKTLKEIDKRDKQECITI